MKSWVVLAVAAAVLLTGSMASAGWRRVAPVVVPAPTIVHSFYPVGPVYAYPAPAVVSVPAPIVYRRSVFYSAPVIYPSAVGYPGTAVVPVPVMVRPRFYVPGQPVRNAIRAAWP